MANETTEKPAEKVEVKAEEPKPKSGKVFFHKHGVNNKIPRPNGTSFKFERLADSQGVIVLDPDADGGVDAGDINAAIAELRSFRKQMKFGLSEVTEEQFNDLKKNQALPAAPASPSATVRIFEPVSPLSKLVGSPSPVPPAEVRGTAPVAGAENIAGPAKVEASSGEPPKPRVGKPVPAKSRGPVESPPQPGA